MKKTIVLLSTAMLILSCNKAQKGSEVQENQTEQIEGESTVLEHSSEMGNFNIENIPFSDADLGDFPFFTLPQGLKEQNKPLQKKFDVCFFPINGVMTAVEGKLYKINVSADQGEEFSQRYFEKSLEDYLLSVGAVKVFDGTITKEEYERYNKKDTNKGGEGDIGYAGETIQLYVIRTKDKGNIYIQFSANNAAGKLNVLQEEAFQQTITKVTADDIVKDLAEKGKSILYINFDLDKSNITAEGKEVVDQIGSALKKDTALKIAIEGHTDNTGDATHNKKLSSERANAVLLALVSQGVDKARLSAKGFGAERPLNGNNSEEQKAKNRRVELVKVN